MSPIEIRLERADHPQVPPLLAALDAYLATLYAPEDNHLLSIEQLLAPEVRFLAAWQGDRVVGCGAVRHMPPEAETGGRAYGEIKRMFVLPELRGRRVAERLLASLEARLPDSGLALLETGRDQLAAVRLYERTGYRRRGPFGGYPENGLSLFLEKRVAA